MTHALVYSQDPGGANIVARVAQRLASASAAAPISIVIHPLSESVFRRLGVPAEPVLRFVPQVPATEPQIDGWLSTAGATHVICTLSSRYLDLTNARLIARARAARVPTLGFLDHWVGFDRFCNEAGDPVYLPDVVGCIDAHSRARLVALGMSPNAVHVVGHPHLEALADDVAASERATGGPLRIVLVSQPSITDGSFLGALLLPWEGRRVIDAIAEALRPLCSGGLAALSYRPHPKETGGGALPDGIAVDRTPAGPGLLASYDVFVGVTSMVLFEAAVCGKAVVQLDMPVLAASVPGEWPPYDAGLRVTDPRSLPDAVRTAAARARAARRSELFDTLALTGSLERAVRLATRFLAAWPAAVPAARGSST